MKAIQKLGQAALSALTRAWEADKALAVTTSVTTTSHVAFQGYTMGNYEIPSGSPLTLITFHGCTRGDTWGALKDRNNIAVTQTVAAGGVYPLPYECAGCKAIKLVGNDVGDVYLSLKG